MIWELRVDPLQEAVALAGGDEVGEVAARCVEAGIELAMDDVAVLGRRGDRAVYGGSGACRAGDEREGCAAGELNGGESDERDAEGGEVAAQHGVDAARVVGREGLDSAGDGGAGGDDEVVVDVDRIDEMAEDRGAGAQAEVALNGDGERRAHGNGGCGGSAAERQEQECEEEGPGGHEECYGWDSCGKKKQRRGTMSTAFADGRRGGLAEFVHALDAELEVPGAGGLEGAG